MRLGGRPLCLGSLLSISRRSVSTSKSGDAMEGLRIGGNAPDYIKDVLARLLSLYRNGGKSFGALILEIKVSEISILPHPDKPSKMEARVAGEVEEVM